MTGTIFDRGGDVAETQSLPDRLERFLQAYRGAFRRRDQLRWAQAYLQGLLAAPGRKTVENLARAIQLPAGLRAEDVAQALGHFVNQSPWDESLLWRTHHERLAQLPGIDHGFFVLEEMAFVKQGRHSVGVQRQFSRALGCKTNCQLAVVLHHVGPAGCFPLALRLYLPRGWLADEARLEAAGVPATARQLRTRLELGLELLEAARTAGLGAKALAAGTGWQANEEMEAGARERGMGYRERVPGEHVEALEQGRRGLLEELGLEHFEGRSWRGLHHHACLVTLASSFLAGS